MLTYQDFPHYRNGFTPGFIGEITSYIMTECGIAHDMGRIYAFVDSLPDNVIEFVEESGEETFIRRVLMERYVIDTVKNNVSEYVYYAGYDPLLDAYAAHILAFN